MIQEIQTPELACTSAPQRYIRVYRAEGVHGETIVSIGAYRSDGSGSWNVHIPASRVEELVSALRYTAGGPLTKALIEAEQAQR